MTAFEGVTHAPGPDGMFAAVALCGADPSANAGGVLRMEQEAYTCLVCLDVASKMAPPVAACEGNRYRSPQDAFAAALDAGFTRWHQAACAGGHWHVSDGRFGGDA